jgi:hypothetical protein
MRFDDMVNGRRVRLARDIDLSQDGRYEAGLTGTVQDRDTDIVWVKLDRHFKALDEWDNSITVWHPARLDTTLWGTTPDDFEPVEVTMPKLTKRRVGSCGVDAGMLMLVDPCYVLGKDAVAYNDDWGEFLKASGMHKGDEWPKYGIVPINRPQSPGHGNAVGVVVHTGHGDGEYPVYAWFDKEGIIHKVEVDFFPEEE